MTFPGFPEVFKNSMTFPGLPGLPGVVATRKKLQELQIIPTNILYRKYFKRLTLLYFLNLEKIMFTEKNLFFREKFVLNNFSM